jgi:hypothetical protein
VPGQDVDRAAVPEVVERKLDHHLPALGREEQHDLIDQRRVLFVDQAVDLRTVAAHRERQVDPHGGSDGPGSVHAEMINMAAFQQRHGLPTDTDSLGDVYLAPPTSFAPEPDRNAEPDVVLGNG